MDTTLFLLIYVTLFLPVIIIFSYMFVKAIQTPVNKPRRIKLSLEDHREIRNKASVAILPFQPDTQHEQEPTQQSKETNNIKPTK